MTAEKDALRPPRKLVLLVPLCIHGLIAALFGVYLAWAGSGSSQTRERFTSK